jgi:hypothetical protein
VVEGVVEEEMEEVAEEEDQKARQWHCHSHQML